MRDQQADSQGDRRIGLDYLRGFVIVLVVLHHAVLAYCRFGHFDPRHYLWSSAPIVDSQRWLGFDIVVLFNDSYFMPLMFLLSGLFVGPSLGRKGRRAYLLDRLRRLGLPFALAVLHYPFVVWGQYALLDSDIGAIPKAACVFVGALALSWCGSAVFLRVRRSVVGFRWG